MPRGGSRTPRYPAATSGPGKLSRRTDGGAGSAKQPIRVPTGGEYGSRAALTAQQQGAPLPVAEATTGGAPPATLTPPASPPIPQGVFGPTNRPYEPPTAGMTQPGMPPVDADAVLRAVYSVFPHPQLLQLMRRA